ncbi:DUF3857 domain-containing transglutaminase family protein [Gynuella sp.]|uniref:DUF3857 domain-containing transglutaminase family protein n=1 Tax=Gynuella sp. TaxID=2969146 RepID=UPI003D11C78B
MLRIFFSGFCLLLSIYLPADTINRYPVPGWVETIDAPAAERLPADQETQYLLVDEQRNFLNSQKGYAKFYHYAEKPLNQDGLMNSGRVEITFYPQYQSVQLHKLTIWRNNKAMDKFSTARSSLLDVEDSADSHLFSEAKQYLIILDDLRLGDTVEVAYTITGSNPVFGSHINYFTGLGWGVPVDRIYKRALLPANHRIKTKIFGYQGDAQLHTETKGSQQTLVWQQDNVPMYSYEEDTPYDEDPYPKLEVTDFNSWKDVSDWATALFSLDRFSPGTKWQNWHQKLSIMKNGEQKILTALKMVQEQIRYVGIEVGQNSHKPHSPNETLSLSYGDCKDKTLLMVSLLRAEGIDAWPALVNTREGAALKDFLPSAKLFDHVITAVQWQGKQYFIDPTKSYQAGNTLAVLGYTGYHYHLPVKAGSDLAAMPRLQSKSSDIIVHETVTTFKYNLPTRMTVTSTYTGNEADYQRYRFSNQSHQEISQTYLNYYDREFGGASIAEDLSISDNTAENIFSVTESYWLQGFWKFNTERPGYEYEVYGSTIDSYMKLPRQLSRKYSHFISSPKDITHILDINYPYIFKQQDLPETHTEDNEFFRFEASTVDYGHKQRFIFHYQNHRDRVPADQVRNYYNMLDKARDYLFYTYWITMDNPLSETDPGDLLFRQTLNISRGEQL